MSVMHIKSSLLIVDFFLTGQTFATKYVIRLSQVKIMELEYGSEEDGNAA
jgi:hypothetical protein